MLYLIHDQQRKKVIEGYYVQVFKIFMWAFIGTSFLIAILAIPTIVLLQTETQIKVGLVKSLTADIASSESKDFENEVLQIQNKITVLKQERSSDARGIYLDIENIVSTVPGVQITNLSVDSLTKTIQLGTDVRDKEVAKNLVDVLQKTRYKGAVLSYSVLSEKASFLFPQNLSYE
jgi:hypothetical protein